MHNLDQTEYLYADTTAAASILVICHFDSKCVLQVLCLVRLSAQTMYDALIITVPARFSNAWSYEMSPRTSGLWLDCGLRVDVTHACFASEQTHSLLMDFFTGANPGFAGGSRMQLSELYPSVSPWTNHTRHQSMLYVCLGVKHVMCGDRSMLLNSAPTNLKNGATRWIRESMERKKSISD